MSSDTVTDGGIQCLSQVLNDELKHLNISGADQVGEVGLLSISECCPNLLSLNISNTGATTVGLRNILICCR